MCGAPATTVGFHTPGFLHTGVIEGLRPNKEYFYQVGDSTPRSDSAVYNFWAAPAPDALSVEFFIFGDLGQAETDGSNEESEMSGSLLTTPAMTRDIHEGVVKLNASAAVFHIGDISSDSLTLSCSHPPLYRTLRLRCGLSSISPDGVPAGYAFGYATVWEQFF